MRNPASPQWLLCLCAVVLAGGGAFVLMEGMVRIWAPQTTYNEAAERFVINGKTEMGLRFYEKSDTLPFTLTSHYRAQIADKKYSFRFSVTLNKEGFRTSEFSPKTSKEVRIVTIGDSTTFGIGSDESDTYSKLLEDSLNSRRTGQPIFKVFNLGIGDYGPVEYYLVAKTYLTIIKPDVVIVTFFTGNDRIDLMNSEITMDANGLPAKVRRKGCYVDEQHLWRNSTAGWIYEWPVARNSHLAIFLARHGHRLIRFLERGTASADQGQLPIPLERLVQGLQDVTENAESKLLVAILPAEYDLALGRDSAFLQAFKVLPNLPVVNLVPEFIGIDKDVHTYYLDGSHLTRDGGQRVAEILSSRVKELLSRFPEASPQ